MMRECLHITKALKILRGSGNLSISSIFTYVRTTIMQSARTAAPLAPMIPIHIKVILCQRLMSEIVDSYICNQSMMNTLDSV